MELTNPQWFKTLDNLFEGVFIVDKNMRIIFWNKEAERITGFKKNNIIGIPCPQGGMEHVSTSGYCLCANKCHLSTAVKEGKAYQEKVYLHHQNGHLIPVMMKVSPIVDEQGQIIGGMQSFKNVVSQQNLLERMAQLEQLALLDQLTQLPNRRHLETALHLRIEELDRYNWPFGILFVDIDNFKAINDNYGHHEGDEVIKSVSKTLMNSLRPFDAMGRWGGEEFIAIVTNVNPDELIDIAERAKKLVSHIKFTKQGGPNKITVSIGATMAQKQDTIDSLINRADMLLYESKHAGKNCVTTDHHEVFT